MSLIASDKGNGTHFEIIPEDTYTAICCEVIDLGLQENKTYDKVQPKVLLGWEIPELQVEIGGVRAKRRRGKFLEMLALTPEIESVRAGAEEKITFCRPIIFSFRP